MPADICSACGRAPLHAEEGLCFQPHRRLCATCCTAWACALEPLAERLGFGPALTAASRDLWAWWLPAMQAAHLELQGAC